MLHTKFALIFVAVIVLMFSASPVQANLVLDQSNDGGTTDSGFDLWAGRGAYQTFTVGVAGKLARVDLPIFRVYPPDPYLEFSETLTLKVSDSKTWVGVTLPYSAFPYLSSALGQSTPNTTLTSFDFSSFGLAVTPGEVLTLSILGDPPMWRWLCDPSKPNYPGGVGNVFFAPDPTLFTLSSQGLGTDFGFRTYVTTVPEPASWLMLAVGGLAALVFKMRRGR